MEESGQRPQKAMQFIKDIPSKGFTKTADVLNDKLLAPVAVGYSASGTVLESQGVTDINIGDRVACAGSQGAYHAEELLVARNLSALVPENVGLQHASTVALGAIALQGVRRLVPRDRGNHRSRWSWDTWTINLSAASGKWL